MPTVSLPSSRPRPATPARADRALWLLLLVAAAGQPGCERALRVVELEPQPPDGGEAPPPSGLGELTLNGRAARSHALTLYQGPYAGAGAAWYPDAVPTDAETSVFYEFHIGSDAGEARRSDGLAFCWHASPEGTAALGGDGGALGIPSPSVCVEQDIFENAYDTSDNELAVVRDGAGNQLAATAAPVDLVAASSRFVWIEHRAGGGLDVYLSDRDARPAEPTLSTQVDLAGWLGPEAWVGFTAASAGSALRFRVLRAEVRVP